LLTRNCVIAKLPPAVRQAGQTSRMPFHPAITTISQKGTMSEKNGSCRPTIADSLSRGRCVTALSAIIGVPRAPKATGAVLPMSARPAASRGRKPRPMSMAPEIATGVPKPAAPSMNAPKLKAMSRAWMRRSSPSPAIVRFTTSNWPVVTVTS
jgi:hypothetical protein